MKRTGISPGLVLEMKGPGQTLTGCEALSGDHAIRIKQGNGHKSVDRKAFKNFSAGDEDIDYLSTQELAAGEESYLRLMMEMQAMPLSKMKQVKPEKHDSTRASGGQVLSGPVSEESRNLMIAQAAYFRALARGFEAGHAEEDWYAAEAEIEQAYGNQN